MTRFGSLRKPPRVFLSGLLTALAVGACGSVTTLPNPAAGIGPLVPTLPTEQAVRFHNADPSTCIGPRHAYDYSDLMLPALSITEFARESIAVALVVGRYQSSYWQEQPSQALTSPLGATPETATDFSVITAYRGSLPAFIQARQRGAPTGALPVCDAEGFESEGDPTPNLGVEYIVFLTTNKGGGVFAPADAWARLEVRNGKVYSGAHQTPFGLQRVDVNGTSLAEVAAAVKAAG